MPAQASLKIDRILPALRAANTRQVHQHLAIALAPLVPLSEIVLYNHLMEHELDASSGIGGGVAIPHLRLPEIEEPVIFFAHLAQPVDFEAVDSRAVDLVFLMASPENPPGEHLSRLARLTRLVRDEAFCAKLRETQDHNALTALFLDMPDTVALAA